MGWPIGCLIVEVKRQEFSVERAENQLQEYMEIALASKDSRLGWTSIVWGILSSGARWKVFALKNSDDHRMKQILFEGWDPDFTEDTAQEFF